jgi:hypothetical protein
MNMFPARTRTSGDGSLHLSIPTGLPDTDVEVLVIVDAVAGGSPAPATADEWPAGFFEAYGGALAGIGFERPDQGASQDRESLQ